MGKNFTKEQVFKALNSTESLKRAANYLNITRSTLKRYITRFNIPVKDFQNQSGKGLTKPKKFKTQEQIFANPTFAPNRILKRELLKEGIKYKCSECGISEWKGKELLLELDHIDGNNQNGLRENLRLLCPNCHSQTKTYRGKNTKRPLKVSDEDLLLALQTSLNIRQALIKVGLTPKGGNYKRANELLAQKPR